MYVYARYICMCMYAICTYVALRVQICGVGSLLPLLCWSLGSNSGHQACLTKTFTAEPSPTPQHCCYPRSCNGILHRNSCVSGWHVIYFLICEINIGILKEFCTELLNLQKWHRREHNSPFTWKSHSHLQ